MNIDLDSFEKQHKHHSFKGICKNCKHDGDLHYGYSANKVICWDIEGKCMCSKFEDLE